MSEPQLQPSELQAFERMRAKAMPYREIAKHFGINERMAHRILTIPGYRLRETTLMRIRSAMQARDQKSSRRSRSKDREARA